MQIKKLAVAAGAAGALALSLVTASPASADYAPSSGDLVGVGSDTLQYAGDFLADGDHLGDSGYNSQGFVNKWVNFDATADANARFAYGAQGAATSCAPGTGTNTGTGNLNANTTGNTVCQQNPTIVLRSGLSPVLRPNGSGAGVKALVKDQLAGAGNIDYARASSSQLSSLGTAANYGTVTIGSERLEIMAKTTGNAVALSDAQLSKIYTASASANNSFSPATYGCAKWGDIKGWNAVTTATPAAATTSITVTNGTGIAANQYVQGKNIAAGTTVVSVTPDALPALTAIVVLSAATTNSSAATAAESLAFTATASNLNAIRAIIPQAGSGTRKSFIGGLSPAVTEGSLSATCVVTAEENDPESIDAQGSANVDAIAPVSSARLNMYKGLDGNGHNNLTGTGTTTGLRYFIDPSCAYGDATNNSGATGACGTVSGTTLVKAAFLVPDVTAFTSGTMTDGGTLYYPSRSLYIYVKTADVNSTTQFQAGINQSKIRATLANPCSGTAQNGHVYVSSDVLCSGGYGIGGAPFIATAGGSSLISASGITPGYSYSATAL